VSETGNEYVDRRGLPGLVARAADIADRFDFRNSCAKAYVPLLQTLTAQVPGGVIGEMGTGAGIGTAWMAIAATPDTRIVTIEKDGERSAAVRELFADAPNVDVVCGDALELASHGPFDLIFCDAGPGKITDQDATIAMTKRGGTILLDDLGPTRTDLDWWYACPDVVTATVWVTPQLGAILAVRR
jgi:predicted O-methyltransferase YrrM